MPLPYDDIVVLRARTAAEWPHLARIGEVEVAAPVLSGAGAEPAGPLPPAFDNYYLTNPVARASATMAACVRDILGGAGALEAAE
jgi:NADH-quinone oxidoreductase subunit G